MLEELSHVTIADIMSEFPTDKSEYPIYVLKQQESNRRESAGVNYGN
jgi:hypothetical protein